MYIKLHGNKKSSISKHQYTVSKYVYFSNFGANTRFFFLSFICTISDLVVFVLVTPCAVYVHPLHACHVSETQWFPLNMLIKIAFKFTEHLCSSTMSNFCRRCFRLLFFFRFASQSSRSWQIIFIGAQCICMCCVSRYFGMCAKSSERKKPFTVDASLL